MKQLVWGLTNKKIKTDVITKGKQYGIMENKFPLNTCLDFNAIQTK